ncbi:Glycosyltransferase, catalytic subunit of cellulose synthase and poly-beta-1,6-N-acetylglucosamine synthase [Streptomyces sp. WMMB 322]|nr:Glycosyltransferase, catalytic subunit of cellulose synthase and poly-beta-1,6-N-acetylglucosamine synthase [Streptomyces sp. WMMB 322]
MHDSGGDRSQTVAALDRMLPRLQAQGYQFPGLTEALGSRGPHTAVHGPDLWKGRAFVAAVGVSESVMGVLTVSLIVAGALVLARFVLMLVLSTVHVRRVRPRRRRRKPGAAPVAGPGAAAGPLPVAGAPVKEPVTVLVPAYNERECIAGTVRSLAASDHTVEVIVIDDGSTDGTAEIVESLGLPGVRVLRQANSGKAAALNNGLRHATFELIAMIDGDTVFEPSTVRELVQPFADPRVGAVAGNAKVGNRRGLIGAWQHIEYVVGFNLDRRMYDVLRCMPTIPGAVGAFRRTALRSAGGLSDDTLAEDTDVTMALHRAGWQVVYAERARAWTEAPGTVKQLWSQRYRWSYGTMQAIWKHRRAVLDRGPSGRFGRVGLPLVAMFTVLAPMLAPLIDVFLVHGLLFGPALRTVAAWLAVLLVQGACAAYAFRLDRERLAPLLTLPLQQLLYRQLMYVVLMQSWITALTGGRLGWQKLRRTGLLNAAPGAKAAYGGGPRAGGGATGTREKSTVG